MDETKTNTKSCKECHRELPATADHYNRHAFTNDGLLSLCKKCQGQRISNSHNRRAKKSPAKPKPVNNPTTVKKESKPDQLLTIDFSKHPQHYEKLSEIAAEEFRTMENQALYFLIKGFETMEELNQKELYHA